MADRFYVNCPLALGPVLVQGAEAHHLAGVRRVRPGDAVCLFNGNGHEYPARVVAVDRRAVHLEVLGRATPQRESPVAVEVAAPLPKGDRAQFLLEKLTELGVASFVPLQTRRSVVHPRDAKLKKLQRYVIEASKQCGRNALLEVKPFTDWETYCRLDKLPGVRVLAHPDGEPACGPWPGAGQMALAVGPEGGFTEEEVARAREAGWRVVGLGPRILRVETAALVLAAWVHCGTMVNRLA
jgi:16S rRNA (uracil1498-N3)-methyltransferase